MDRIEIELGDWESASAPICTNNIKDEDLERAEKELYQIAIASRLATKEEIDQWLNNEGVLTTDQYKREKLIDYLCEEEEKLVIEIGGVYYEDMP
jgi:hypothetical protein